MCTRTTAPTCPPAGRLPAGPARSDPPSGRRAAGSGWLSDQYRTSFRKNKVRKCAALVPQGPLRPDENTSPPINPAPHTLRKSRAAAGCRVGDDWGRPAVGWPGAGRVAHPQPDVRHLCADDRGPSEPTRSPLFGADPQRWLTREPGGPDPSPVLHRDEEEPHRLPWVLLQRVHTRQAAVAEAPEEGPRPVLHARLEPRRTHGENRAGRAANHILRHAPHDGMG
jgi:hypothetical protein